MWGIFAIWRLEFISLGEITLEGTQAYNNILAKIMLGVKMNEKLT